MQKTKLGLSVGLLTSLLFFSGLMSNLIVFLVAGYILLVEENEWLRKAAVKAMVIVALFAVAQGMIGVLGDLFLAVSSITRELPFIGFKVEIPLGLDNSLSYLLRAAESIVLILSGYKALSQGTMKLKIADDLVNTHFTKQ